MVKILIVEDEKILAEMYQKKLFSEGFKVFFALNFNEATKLFQEEKPDLVLLDILLSERSGIDFLKWIKEKKIETIPIIAFSNYEDPKVKEEALRLGAKEYLLKTDYTPSQLVEKIKKILEKK